MRNDRYNTRNTNENNNNNRRRTPYDKVRSEARVDETPPLLDSQEVSDRTTRDSYTPALPPVRQWDNNLYHHVPGVPQPPPQATPAAAPNVVMNVSGGARPKIYDRQPRDSHYEDRQNDDNDYNGYQVVKSRREQRLQRLQDRGTQRGIKGAPAPDYVFLYLTNCDIDTTAEEVELHILENFEQVNEARARSTARSHNYYASFTVTVKGHDLETEDFLNSDAFPLPIKVYLNKNKYNLQEDV